MLAVDVERKDTQGYLAEGGRTPEFPGPIDHLWLFVRDPGDDLGAAFYANRSREGQRSIAGIILTSLSLATMWLLAVAKHREGHRIDCLPLIADSRETRLCSLLSGVTLAGLALNAAFGWWWADPVAALGIGVLAFAEGYEAISGEHPEHQ
jgi:hypothetical protein